MNFLIRFFIKIKLNFCQITNIFFRVIFWLIVACIVIELASYVGTYLYIANNKYIKHTANYPEAALRWPFEKEHLVKFEKNYKAVAFRPIAGEKYLKYKAPVVIFGCSFAYGSGLADNQTFSYKLSQEMKRTVYNRAFSGWGAQHMLWQLQNESFLDSIEEPEFVIYVFISDHIRRISAYLIDITKFFLFTNDYIFEYLRYKDVEGTLVRNRMAAPFAYTTNTANLFINLYQNRKYFDFMETGKHKEDYFNLLKLHLIESKRLVRKKWPNAKFIILIYESGFVYDSKTEPVFWREISQTGFDVIDAKKEFGIGSHDKKYTISDTDVHPNEHAWDIIVPQLVRKLKEIK